MLSQTVLSIGITRRFQEAIDSTDSSCNPSHTLQVGTMKESLLLQYWLEQGMAINIPDYDGNAITWITNAEGKMVLDSLRAMKNDTALGLTDSGIALYGYSGGGSATIHTAELRQTYAPDVRLLGAAFGAAPTNLTSLLNYATSSEPGLTGTVNFGAPLLRHSRPHRRIPTNERVPERPRHETRNSKPFPSSQTGSPTTPFAAPPIGRGIRLSPTWWTRHVLEPGRRSNHQCLDTSRQGRFDSGVALW
ncbi:lipase family protein [Nocardia tengchongensis]|uniref:lipase family protein n=1 Tax=Nocardia tengchongensis TaxID=2055889 RepID=UPI0036BDC123